MSKIFDKKITNFEEVVKNHVNAIDKVKKNKKAFRDYMDELKNEFYEYLSNDYRKIN